MTDLCLGLALFLLVTIVLGLVRIRRGPSAADRMLSAQLFGTTGVAILLLLGQATNRTFWWDMALVFALLSAITAIAFVSRSESIETAEEQRDDHGS
jgi:multicomponent Na+:H+ antiporter subunit F